MSTPNNNNNNPNDQEKDLERNVAKATTPGVRSVAAEEAARLDALIAEKRDGVAQPQPDTASAFEAVDQRKPPARKPAAVSEPPASMQAFEHAVLSDTAVSEKLFPAPAMVTGDPVKEDNYPVVENTVSMKESAVKEDLLPESALAVSEVAGQDVEYGVYEPNEDGLAVAMPVMEDDEDVFIPSAVEYDPDAKPPLHRNRRFRLYAFLAFFALVACAVGATIGIVLSGNDDDSVEPREQVGIREAVARVVGSQNLADLNSPYAKALQWIIYDDQLQLTPLNETFVQRYILSYFYFATTEDGEWLSCNPYNATNEEANLVEGQEVDEEAKAACRFEKLIALEPTEYNTVNSARWLSSKPECQWAGIECDATNQVRSIILSAHSLSGDFPEGIVHLPFLQAISLDMNSLRGTIPPEISQLKHLVNIELQLNAMSGELPNELYDMRNLVRLNLGENKFQGRLSTRIGQMRDMKGLYLYNNAFTGPIPTEIGQLQSMTYLRMNRNQLTGQIPTEFGNLRGIRDLWLSDNQLTGTLPDEVSQLTLLQDFRINRNPELGGLFPPSFWDLPSLIWIDIRACSFSGSVGEGVARMSGLSVLRIASNNFTGNLPAGMANLEYIQSVWLMNTDMTGTIPPEICAAVDGNSWTDFNADCNGPTPELECPCCSGCCDADGSNCVKIDL